MKRLIAAAVILIFIISVCVCAHVCVDRACKQTLTDIENYYNKSITHQQLENSWKKNKEKMAFFANHGFLDKISVYIGQLDLVSQGGNTPENDLTYKNIQTVLSLIKEEQKLGLHSFY